MRAATAVAALAQHARRAPTDPWLFYRDGWDWAWRSWRRVADQVARGSESLQRFTGDGFASDRAVARIAFDARQDPDAIAAGLAIQANGAVAVPLVDSELEATRVTGCDAWAEVEGGLSPGSIPPSLERIVLPAALTQLDRAERRSLEPPRAAVAAAVAVAGSTTLPATELMMAARRLDSRLQPWDRRPVVCAAPNLDLVASQLIQAWALVSGAAWVLEPHPEAFVPTVLWARPSLIFADADGLSRLASQLKIRKHRRHSRLQVAVLVGDGAVEDGAVEDDMVENGPWRDAGVRIVAMGENPLQSLHGEIASNPDPTNDIP